MSRRRDTPYDTPYYLDWSCVTDQNPGFNFTHVRGVPHISFMFSGYFTHILREWNLHEFPGGCCGPRVDFNFTHVGKNDPTHTHSKLSAVAFFFARLVRRHSSTMQLRSLWKPWSWAATASSWLLERQSSKFKISGDFLKCPWIIHGTIAVYLPIHE